MRYLTARNQISFAAAKLGTLIAISLISACDSSTDFDEKLPEFTGSQVSFGALLCVGGEFSAKASGLERAAIFAEELVNGSAYAYPDVDESEIPCRKNDTCGTWAGRNSDGESLRGRLKVVIADSEERVERAVSAARSLVDDYQVPIIIGPCSSQEMFAVQSEVTQTNTVLFSPIVTTNSISDIDDRTGVDKQANLPGYVYRNIVPDYIQMGVLADFGTNTDSRNRVLIRNEDRSSNECTAEVDPSYCSKNFGASSVCVRSYNTAEAERDFYQVTEEACSGQAENYCDKLGQNYTCLDGVCQRFRERRYCTNDVRPAVAMVLYEDSNFGRDLLANIEQSWEVNRERPIVATAAFDPTSTADFGLRITELFTEGNAQVQALKAAGDLPADYDFGDTVVFLFARATEGALLLQEWELQQSTLPASSSRVFWLGTDALRSNLLLNQVGVRTARNLFTVDPYVIQADQEAAFIARYRARWGVDPDGYAANTVDAILLAALANDRAGFVRERSLSGALGANNAYELKNSLQPVSVGCRTDVLPQALYPGCANPETIAGIPWDRPEVSVATLRAGDEIKLLGITGNLWLSPAGDVLNRVRMWKVATDGAAPGFFPVAAIEPAINGILLTK